MKKQINFFLVLCMLLLAGKMPVWGQAEIPQASPPATLTQRIGLTDIAVTYCRPSVRGRIIFGSLVPYDRLWRTGANASTKISFSRNVTIEGNPLPAGEYALFTIPGRNEWTIIFSTNTELWGASNYQPRYDALRIQLKPQTLPMDVETFTMNIGNITYQAAEITLSWERTMVAFQVGTESDAEMMTLIEQAMTNPLERLAGQYISAANYYYETNRDLDRALEWINQAIEIEPEAYWAIHLKAKILAKKQDFKEAIRSAELSKKKAQAQNDLSYIEMNEQYIAQWKKMP